MKLNQFAFIRAFGRWFSSQIEPPTECFFNSMKSIPWLEWYFLTDDFRIVNSKGKELYNSLSFWYRVYSICYQGRTMAVRLHRVIAQIYVPNPDNKPQVNHKNWVRDDNRVENLEWVTAQENVLHGYRSNWRINERRKRVWQYDIYGKLIKEYDYIMEVTKFWFHYKNVYACAKWYRKTCSWFIWKLI